MEGIHQVLVNHAAQLLVGDIGNLAHFVGGAETIEEVDEGHAAFQRGRVGNGGHIRGFLGGGAAKHGEAGGAGAHHVAVITENGKTLGCKGAGSNVEDAGGQLTGNLEHVGNHEQQTLGGRERGGHGAGLQCAVHSTGSTCLRFHLDDAGDRAPEILAIYSGPGFCRLTHRGGRGDGVDSGHFRAAVRYGGHSLVGVNSAICCVHMITMFWKMKADVDNSPIV